MSGGITVISRTQTIIVEPTSGSVSIINAGPAGPAGPSGSGGGPWVESGGWVYLDPAVDGVTVSSSDGTNIDVANGGNITAVASDAITLDSDQDVNISGDRNVNILSEGGSNQDVNIGAGRDIRMDYSGTDQIAIKSRNTPATDGRINNESFVPYLDSSTNTLKFRVRMADGSYKTGSIALT